MISLSVPSRSAVCSMLFGRWRCVSRSKIRVVLIAFLPLHMYSLYELLGDSPLRKKRIFVVVSNESVQLTLFSLNTRITWSTSSTTTAIISNDFLQRNLRISAINVKVSVTVMVGKSKS